MHGLDLTLDLSQVTFMDSMGLNTLLRRRWRACEEGATLHLSGVTGPAALWPRAGRCVTSPAK
ncbi:anti-sigma factor antagonist [Streptomyces sp. WAC07149]|nr:anti-sigma factor antagonist [Streptomyces sp. WAC07149]